MKENNSFIKLLLLNKWKRKILILDSKIKEIFIKGMGGKE